MAQLSAAKVMLSILANRPDPTAQAYDVLTHLYYRQLPKLQYWNFGRWNDSAYLSFAEIAVYWEAPLLLKNICPDSGQIREPKYDWSLAQPDTKLITTNADGEVTEWLGDIDSELCVQVSCEYIWIRSHDNSPEKNNEIHQYFYPKTLIQKFIGNWQSSAELRPSLQKKPYPKLATDDDYQPFVTPESLVNDIKAGQP